MDNETQGNICKALQTFILSYNIKELMVYEDKVSHVFKVISHMHK